MIDLSLSRGVGLGCMRLSTDADRDETRALDVLRAAIDAFTTLDPRDASVLVLDTAHAYALDDDELGHNERLVARALASTAPATRARITVVTKCGMTRPDGRWEPDGRASAIRASAEASLRALDTDALDVLLLHAPDPSVPLATSVRALAKLHDEKLARHIGLSNVNLTQLREARDLAPVTVVEVALSPFADTPVRGGVVACCAEHGVPLLAHSPLGGTKRAARLARNPAIAKIAQKHGASAHAVVLAWLRAIAPVVVPIPGARRPETARDSVLSRRLVLDDDDITSLRDHFARMPAVARARPTSSIAIARSAAKPSSATHDVYDARGGDATHAIAADSATREIVLLMGIPGAGKSTLVRSFVDRGYTRLNRDLEGRSLAKLVALLDAELLSGAASRFVLDNTYATRASRHDVIAIARMHDAAVRCVWIDTSIEDAQVNAVLRLLEKHGALPDPALLRALARKDPHAFLPTVQHRFRRELEPPALDEGFADVERFAFTRAPASPDRARAATVVALEALAGAPPDPAHVASFVARVSSALDAASIELASPSDPSRPILALGWLPNASADLLRAIEHATRDALGRALDLRICAHPGGPPVCWCRPPLPGLPLALAHDHAFDPRASTLVGSTTAHRTLASITGMRFVEVAPPTSNV